MDEFLDGCVALFLVGVFVYGVVSSTVESVVQALAPIFGG